MDDGRNLYSDARLEKLLQENAPETAEATVDTVLSSVKRFETGAEQADDITILALRFSGRGVKNSNPLNDPDFTREMLAD